MKNLQRLVANLNGTTRKDTMMGKEYTVVPMVMAVEGVLNGSGGALLYPGSELAKYPVTWNNKPVVVYHPKINGQGVSACDPNILTSHQIGVIMNTKFEDNKLKAEAWLEDERVAAVDPRVSEALENNTMMELSTGLFTENVAESGTFNGEDYVAIAKNYRPDHLAVLPDQEGACSIEDGAGFLRMNEAGDALEVLMDNLTDEQKAKVKTNKEHLSHTVTQFILNDLSFDDIRQLLYGQLRDAQGEDAWIEEVFEEYVVFEKNGTLHKQPYTMVDGEPKFEGLPEDVVKDVQYIKANEENISENERNTDMDKKAKIEALIANAGTQWTEDDKDFLTTLEEAALDKMTPVANDTTPPAKKEEPAKAPDKVEPAAVTDNTQKTLDQYVADAPPIVASILRNGVQQYAAEKKRLINTITANEKNTFTAEQLGAMEVDQLAPIANLCSNAKEVTPLQDLLNFAGQGEVVANKVTENAETGLPLPVMEFGS